MHIVRPIKTSWLLLPFLVTFCGISNAKVISVTPGTPTFAYGFWYYLNCTTSLGLGSLSVNIAPKHGTVTTGSTSGPIPECPAGSPSLPLASSTYTMNLTTPPAESDYFQLEAFLNGRDLGPVSVYVLNGSIVGKGLGGCNCSGKSVVGGPPDANSGGAGAGEGSAASSSGSGSGNYVRTLASSYGGMSVGSGNAFYSVTDYTTSGQKPPCLYALLQRPANSCNAGSTSSSSASRTQCDPRLGDRRELAVQLRPIPQNHIELNHHRGAPGRAADHVHPERLRLDPG